MYGSWRFSKPITNINGDIFFLHCRPNEEEDGSKNSVITDQIAISIIVDVRIYMYIVS